MLSRSSSHSTHRPSVSQSPTVPLAGAPTSLAQLPHLLARGDVGRGPLHEAASIVSDHADASARSSTMRSKATSSRLAPPELVELWHVG